MSALDIFAADARWVTWRLIKRRGKPTKIPYSISGEEAETDNPATWATRAQVESVARRYPNGPNGGIGFILGDLGADNWLCGVDLDTCFFEGKFEAWAADVIDRFQSYTEVSPGGEGAKIYFLVDTDDIPMIRQAMGTEHGRQWKRSARGDHPPSIELYTSNRYFAVTAKHLVETPDSVQCVAADTVLWLINEHGPAFAGKQPHENGQDKSRSAKAWFHGNEAHRHGHSFEQFCKAVREDPDTTSWYHEKGTANNFRELRRIWQKVTGNKLPPVTVEGVILDDFYAFMPQHNYIFVPTRATWPAGSVNARIPPIKLTDDNGSPVLDKDGKQIRLSASAWLDRFKPVEQMTWAPCQPMIIDDKLILEGGWIERSGCRCFNLYYPPTTIPGLAAEASRWLDHVRYVFPEDAEHIFDWLAHRVQRPWDKINHALVLGGAQGIGKDTLLEPAKHAVGPWNCQEVSPTQILGRFNGFLKSVILRVNEARDLGEFDRFQLYDHMKACTAAPPDVLRIDEKHLRETSIVNCCGVVITSNHKTDGIFLPADDRRHYVAWSDRTKEDPKFDAVYWNKLWMWYANGGLRHVTAFLKSRNLSNFDPKAPPKKTEAFWAIVNASRAPEESELADAIDNLGQPDALTVGKVINSTLNAHGELSEFGLWLRDRKNRRIIPHRLEQCGYVPVRNPTATDGLWKIEGRRQAVYAKATLAIRDQILAASELAKRN